MNKRNNAKFFTILMIVILFVGTSISLAILILNKDTVKLQDVERTMEEGNLEKAEDEVLEFLSENENEPEGWLVYGKIAFEQGDLSEAEEFFLEAIRLDPNQHKAYSALGTIERIRGNLQKSQDYYQKAIDIDKTYAPAHSGLSLTYLDMELFEKAIEPGEESVELDSDNAVFAANLSIVYHFNYIDEKRDEMYEKAKELGYPNLNQLAAIYISRDLGDSKEQYESTKITEWDQEYADYIMQLIYEQLEESAKLRDSI